MRRSDRTSDGKAKRECPDLKKGRLPAFGIPPAEQDATLSNQPASGGTRELPCRRLSRSSMMCVISLDDHPGGAIDCLRNMLAFVMDCLSAMRIGQEWRLTEEGITGLWSMLHMIETGLKEIQEAMSI